MKKTGEASPLTLYIMRKYQFNWSNWAYVSQLFYPMTFEHTLWKETQFVYTVTIGV